MRNKILTAALVLGGFTTLMLASCGKDEIYDNTPKSDDFNNMAVVKFYNGILNSNRTHIYIDGKKMNGETVTLGASFPAHSSNFGIAILPGVHEVVVKDTLGSTTQLPLNFPVNLQANTRYNVYLYDSINAPKQVTVETKVEIPTDTSSRLRIAHFWRVPAGVPPAVDVYSKKLGRNIFTNLQYTQVSDFIPYPSAYGDTLLFNEAGTSNLISQVTGYSTTRKRGYTLVLRGGYYTTTGTNIRSITSVPEY